MSSNDPDLDTLSLSNPDVPCHFPCPYAGEKDVECRIFPLSRLLVISSKLLNLTAKKKNYSILVGPFSRRKRSSL